MKYQKGALNNGNTQLLDYMTRGAFKQEGSPCFLARQIVDSYINWYRKEKEELDTSVDSLKL